VKPLYLNCNREVLLVLDGPSLLVTGKNQPLLRYPLRELTRVVVWGNPRIDCTAIRGCLAHGITVTFVGADGPAGYALPATGERMRLAGRIEALLDRDDAVSRYDDWRRAVERREIAIALSRCSASCTDRRPQQVENCLVKLLPDSLPDVRTLRRLAEGVLASRMASWFASRRIDPKLVTVRRPRFNLISDGAKVLSWAFYPDWRKWLDANPAPAGDWSRPAIACIEEHSRRDEARVKQLMGRFCAWLGSME